MNGLLLQLRRSVRRILRHFRSRSVTLCKLDNFEIVPISIQTSSSSISVRQRSKHNLLADPNSLCPEWRNPTQTGCTVHLIS